MVNALDKNINKVKSMDINRYSPSYSIQQRHMTKLATYSTEEIFELLYAIKAMKSKFIAHEDTAILKGVTVATLYGDTSTRTRSALSIGIRQLGGDTVNIPYSKTDMLAGENIKDIVNVISRYGVGALVTRGIEQSDLDEFCMVSQTPIINSANTDFLPVQTLCDLYTIWEKKGRLEGLKIAYVGKGNNNVASLIMGAIKCGMDVSLAMPTEFTVNPTHLASAEQYGTIHVTDNPAVAVKNADIVYTDSYNYHDQLTSEEMAIFKPYQVNNALFSLASPEAIFMHPLPAKRGLEVTADVIDGKKSIVYDQAENKLHTFKAIFALLIK